MAEAYGWSYDAVLRLTMPQLLMLRHAAWVNKQRMDARLKKNRNGESVRERIEADMNLTNEPVFNGKRFDELTSDEYLAYMNS